VLFPVTALRMATKAIDQMLSELRSRGTQLNLLERMQTRQQLYELLRYAEYEQRDRHFHSTDDDHADR
ncbi:MAG TPA: methylisocitrate lyase, partial [Nitrospira sp.]|nr:methylisocitrate lyase [Nitrospira sp.]